MVRSFPKAMCHVSEHSHYLHFRQPKWYSAYMGARMRASVRACVRVWIYTF
jgi:hypothetical protein